MQLLCRLTAYILVLSVDLVELTQGKVLGILEAGIIMTIIIKMVEEAMKMKMHGTKTLVPIMTILVTQRMVADQEAKVMDLVETKVDPVVPKDVVEEIAAQEVEWEVVVPRSEEHMPTLYPTRKSHSPVTVSHKILFC